MKSVGMMSKLNYKEWMMLLLLSGLMVLIVVVNYYFVLTPSVKVLVWSLWIALTIVLAFNTEKGQASYAFSKAAKLELMKVVWPTKKETIQTTLIVMIMVAVSGLILWFADSIMIWSIGKITHLS